MSKEISRYDMAVGERAAHIRNVLAMSSKEVAERIGITRQTLGNYESGRTPMKASTVRQLCLVYGCEPIWLLGMSDTLILRRKVNGRLIELREESPSIQTEEYGG